MQVKLNGGWTTLWNLREGAIFQTREGVRAVKSEYHYPNGGCQCVLLASGEYAHFAQDGDPATSGRRHNETMVQEIEII